MTEICGHSQVHKSARVCKLLQRPQTDADATLRVAVDAKRLDTNASF